MMVQIYALFSNLPNYRRVFCYFMFNSTLLGYMLSLFLLSYNFLFRIFAAETEYLLKTD